MNPLRWTCKGTRTLASELRKQGFAVGPSTVRELLRELGYEPKGQPRQTDTHDFLDKKKGKAVPYGVYDIHRNEAFVSVGISCDTAEFAVAAIRMWW